MPRLHVIAAWAEIEQNHWPAAQTQIEQALTLEPDDPTDLLTLAVIKIKEGSVGKAAALLEKAEASLTHALLEFKATEQTESEVIHAFNEALSGRPKDAKMEFRAILVRDPKNSGATKGLAILQHEPSAASGRPKVSHVQDSCRDENCAVPHILACLSRRDCLKSEIGNVML